MGLSPNVGGSPVPDKPERGLATVGGPDPTPKGSLVALSFPRTRALQAASAAYAVYAAAKPEHLPRMLNDAAGDNGLRLAYTYAARDLTTSTLGVFGPSRLVPVAAALRVASDLGDSVVLGSTTRGSVRAKAVAITTAWAALNSAALWGDLRARR